MSHSLKRLGVLCNLSSSSNSCSNRPICSVTAQPHSRERKEASEKSKEKKSQDVGAAKQPSSWQIHAGAVRIAVVHY